MAAENNSPSLLPFNTMIHMVIIKLSSPNYLLWKSQLLPLLESQELLGHVDGTLQPPPCFDPVSSKTPSIKHLVWKNTDQRLLSLLLSSLTEEAMAEVVGLSTSREVWLSLENTFSHRSKAREIRLKDDLQLMKHETRSVTEYAGAFKALCDQLHAIGRAINDTDKVHWFLRGLGLEFTSFSTAQMAQTPLPSFSDLVSKAESFELFQRSLESSGPPNAAFTVTNHGNHCSKSSHSNRNHQGRNLSSNLYMVSKPILLCDNKSALFLSSNPVSHKGAKHVELDYHFLRELVVASKLLTQYVPSHLQVADLFTKSVSRPLFEFLRTKLHVRSNSTLSLRGGVKDTLPQSAA